MSRGKSFRAPWPDSVSRPVVSPLQPSVVYASRDPDALDRQYEGGETGYTYAREGHPNADVLAGLLDGLERAEGGIVTGSGMAAVTVALLANLKAGDHVIGADQLYGRSLRLMTEDLPRFGIETSLVDPTDAARVAAAVRPETRMILIETVSATWPRAMAKCASAWRFWPPRWARRRRPSIAGWPSADSIRSRCGSSGPVPPRRTLPRPWRVWPV